MVVIFGEPFFNGHGARRAISKWLWSLKSRFSMIVDLKKLFLNDYGS
jgi:hypothetical protein